MVVTNNECLAKRCRSLRNLCFQAGDMRFVHEELGWNYRMTNLQAALGLAQLERLDNHVKRKHQIGALYTKQLQDMTGLQLPHCKTDYAQNIFWVYGIVLADNFSFDAKKVIHELAKQKIGSRPFFWPMHQQPVLKRMGLFENESYPVAERVASRGFYVPGGLALTDTQIKHVVNCLRNILK